MPPDSHQPFRNRLATGSHYMDPEEIDSILRIQWKSLHGGSPYVEDYYYRSVGRVLHSLFESSSDTCSPELRVKAGQGLCVERTLYTLLYTVISVHRLEHTCQTCSVN